VLTGRFKHDESKVDIRSVVREINDTLKDEEMRQEAIVLRQQKLKQPL
jgi:RIO kinase 1